ncbi:MAG TPA: c-type cytochrome biogenesis protein CcmI [Mesorhizobium sp.]|jgi:cytochrome c-type biogenesis protein CcmH|nr:c-type cytochrome biogenesis protein CcmI [Mesorhizobium sp.]
MLFWIIAALLTLGASLAVLLPLSSRDEEAEDGSHAPDLDIYRDQLGEIDGDEARGLIGRAEAEEARAEIGRRILKLDRERSGAKAAGSGARKVFAAAAVLAVPLLSWGLYAGLGSPHLPSQPLEARLNKDPAQSTPEELLARAERRLRSAPEDGAGWDAVAPAYLQMGRFADAAQSFGNAIRLLGATAVREAGLGEALTGQAQGEVVPEARAAFERALAIDPRNGLARFRLAQAKAQDGDRQAALHAWRAMQADLPETSPWRPVVAEAIAQSERQAGAAAAPGPTEEQVESASALPEEERSAMIEDMVASLDAKLREEPGDAEGWMKLVRSYAVLGRQEQAQDALLRGTEALGRESDGARTLAALARSLGVSVGAQP